MNRTWNPRYECLPREDLKALQEQKFLRQIKHIHAFSSFYNKKLDESGVRVESIRTLDDIGMIPPTTPEELRGAVKQGPDPWGGRLCVPEEKLLFYLSPQEPAVDEGSLLTAVTAFDRDMVIEELLRLWSMLNIGPERVVQAQCWGWEALNTVYLSSYSSRYLSPSVSDVMKCTIIPMEIMVSDVPRTVHSAMFFQPQAFFTNMENIEAMEKEVGNQGLGLEELGYETIVIRECGKAMANEQRAEIERKWGAKAYSMLEIQECLFYASECNCQEGFHVYEDLFLVEITDTEGHQVSKIGDRGKLTLTNLFAEATPLLRYQTGIDAMLYDSPCICGRTSSRLALR